MNPYLSRLNAKKGDFPTRKQPNMALNPVVGKGLGGLPRRDDEEFDLFIGLNTDGLTINLFDENFSISNNSGTLPSLVGPINSIMGISEAGTYLLVEDDNGGGNHIARIYRIDFNSGFTLIHSQTSGTFALDGDVSENVDMFITTGSNGTIHEARDFSGTLIHSFDPGNSTVADAITPDGLWVASAYATSQATAWKPSTSQTFNDNFTGLNCNGASTSHDSNFLYVPTAISSTASDNLLSIRDIGGASFSNVQSLCVSCCASRESGLFASIFHVKNNPTGDVQTDMKIFNINDIVVGNEILTVNFPADVSTSFEFYGFSSDDKFIYFRSLNFGSSKWEVYRTVVTNGDTEKLFTSSGSGQQEVSNFRFLKR